MLQSLPRRQIDSAPAEFYSSSRGWSSLRRWLSVFGFGFGSMPTLLAPASEYICLAPNTHTHTYPHTQWSRAAVVCFVTHWRFRFGFKFLGGSLCIREGWGGSRRISFKFAVNAITCLPIVCGCGCVCVGVCSSFWPKAMSGLWPKCLPVCDFYAPVANRQSSTSIDASISPSTSHLLHEMLLYWFTWFVSGLFYALLLNALYPQRRQRFLLLASIKIQIQHACQGNKPTIYTQASWPRPPQWGEEGSGDTSCALPCLPAGRKTTIKLRNFSIYAWDTWRRWWLVCVCATPTCTAGTGTRTCRARAQAHKAS